MADKAPQQLYFDNVSPATRLLEKRRQMYEVQDALDSQKARFSREEEQFRKKEEQLRAKDLSLQHQLVRFNKFLQDNEAKRRRAETRAAEEAAQIRQKEDEIRELERQLDHCRSQCGELEEEVTANMKYEEFLEKVKDTSDEWHEIMDLVTRFETLESANKDLIEVQTVSNDRIENLRKEFADYRRRAEMNMLEMNNHVAELSGELDESQKERQHLEHKVEEATHEDSKHSLYFGQILMSVENLFLRCTTKRKNIQHATTPIIDENEAAKSKEEEGQEVNKDSFRRKKAKAIRELNVILNYLKDFKEITEAIKRERRADPKQQRVAAVLDVEPEVEFVKEKIGGGDRGSQNSGSQVLGAGSTKDMSRQGTTAAGPSATVN